MDQQTIREIQAKTSRVKRRINLRVVLRWCPVGGGVVGAVGAFVLWAATGLHTLIDPVGPAALGALAGAAAGFWVGIVVVSLCRAAQIVADGAGPARESHSASTGNTDS